MGDGRNVAVLWWCPDNELHVWVMLTYTWYFQNRPQRIMHDVQFLMSVLGLVVCAFLVICQTTVRLGRTCSSHIVYLTVTPEVFKPQSSPMPYLSQSEARVGLHKQRPQKRLGLMCQPTCQTSMKCDNWHNPSSVLKAVLCADNFLKALWGQDLICFYNCCFFVYVVQ